MLQPFQCFNFEHMILSSNAKINLGLNILYKREDGFHEIQTLMLPIALGDRLSVEESAVFSFECQGMQLVEGENLCVKAYSLLKKEFSIPNVSIKLQKNVPIGAGLGGGSSNAAFVLKALNQLFNLKLKQDDLENYAQRLGSDCAFFIGNTTAIARGKGERLEKYPLDLSDYLVLLVNPQIHISTAAAYSEIRPNKHPFSPESIKELNMVNWQSEIVNDFERSVFHKYPEIRHIKEQLIKSGASYSSMSGSGSTVYGIFEKGKIPSIKWPAHYFVWSGAVI